MPLSIPTDSVEHDYATLFAGDQPRWSAGILDWTKLEQRLQGFSDNPAQFSSPLAYTFRKDDTLYLVTDAYTDETRPSNLPFLLSNAQGVVYGPRDIVFDREITLASALYDAMKEAHHLTAAGTPQVEQKGGQKTLRPHSSIAWAFLADLARITQKQEACLPPPRALMCQLARMRNAELEG